MPRVKFDIEEVIDLYCPSEEPFEVTTASGHTFTFRAHQDSDELDGFIKAFAVWYRSVSKTAVFKDVSPDDAYKVYMVSELSVDPKIEQTTALRMLKSPGLMFELKQGIDKGCKFSFETQDREEVEAKKNGLTETIGSTQGSSSAETHSESTPTS